MKASELISMLKHYPDAEILVSTTEYYEKTRQEAGYKQGKYQKLNSIAIEVGRDNVIKLNGGDVKII